MTAYAIGWFGSLSMASKSNCSARATSCCTEACWNELLPHPLANRPSRSLAIPILASVERGSISKARSNARKASCPALGDWGPYHKAQPRMLQMSKIWLDFFNPGKTRADHSVT